MLFASCMPHQVYEALEDLPRPSLEDSDINIPVLAAIAAWDTM